MGKDGKNRIFLWLFLFVILTVLSIFSYKNIPTDTKQENKGSESRISKENNLKDFKKYSFKYTNKINTKGQAATLRFILPIPQDEINKQYISSIKLTPKPDKIINEDLNKIAVYDFKNVPSGNIIISLEGIINTKTYDLKTAKKINKNPKKEENLSRYLKSEPLIESDDKYIQNIARNIKGNTQEEIIQNIYEYIQKTITYEAIPKNIGAKQALKLKKGKCSEYSAAMVALCRAKNIPARIVAGNITRTTNQRHCWVEVYYEKYGWVTYDPTIFATKINIYNHQGKLIKQERKLDGSNININYIASSRNEFSSWKLYYTYKENASFRANVEENIQINALQ